MNQLLRFKGFLGLIICLQVTALANAQDSVAHVAPGAKKKGEFYLTWGYNRDFYTKSDIRFHSTNTSDKAHAYDFTFYNAKAHDKPSMDQWWHINRLTIPQYDLHLGYFFNDKHNLGIEVGWNHLKYVVTDNQMMRMSGTIGESKFVNKDTVVTPAFVHLQHTNGNNYALVNLVKRQTLWSSRHFQLNAIGKVGMGPLMSVTISSIMGEDHRTGFQFQGWVFAASAGLRFNVYKYFFIQGDMQGALADYTHSKIGSDVYKGISSQHFYSLQYLWAGGVRVPL